MYSVRGSILRPPPPPRTVPATDFAQRREPRLHWKFWLYCAGARAVRPRGLGPAAERSSPQVHTARTAAADVSSWVAVSMLSGARHWWSLRSDNTVAGLYTVPPLHAEATWYAWEREGSWFTFQNVLTGRCFCKRVPQSALPAPSAAPGDLHWRPVLPGGTSLSSECAAVRTHYFVDASGRRFCYSLQLPRFFDEGAAAADEGLVRRWPLLFFMHGGGKRFLHSNMSDGGEGLRFAADNFVIASPHATWDWRREPDDWAQQLFRSLQSAPWIDGRRCYVAGCSMGGMSTLELCASVSNIVAAAAAVAPHHNSARRGLLADRLKDVPLLALASYADKTCRWYHEAVLWERMIRQGNDHLFAAVIPGVQHHSMFDEAYSNDSTVFQWLLSHELQG